MRARLVVIGWIGLFGLACTGAVETPEAEVPDRAHEDEPSEGGERGKKRRRPRGGDDGEEEGGEDDGGDGGSPAPKPAPVAPEGIEQVDATTWKVDKKLKNQWMNDPEKLGADARAKGKGYELKQIQDTDDAWHIGLRNGDVVKEINGYSLATEAEAIAAYAALKDAKKLEVKIRRGDGPVHHTYVIE